MINSNPKKGIYISFDHIIDTDNIDLSKVNNGIIKKIVNQYNCLEEYGFDMVMFCPYKNRNHRIHSIVRRIPFSGIIPFGEKYIQKADEYSFIYLRKPWFMDSDVRPFLHQMKKRNPQIKVVLEVPTFDLASTEKGEINHLHMWPLYWKDQNSVKKLDNVVDRVLTFSRDETIYGIETICTCNAINPDQVRRVNHIDNNDDTIHLIACSSMAFWHGFDRVIEGMKKYKNTVSSKYNFVFHLVGEGEELNRYKRMIVDYGLDSDIIIHGFKSGSELDIIYDMCDIAIDSMGRHRSNTFYNSSLKGKEYLAKGLPVISGVTNELDYDESFKYYYRVPADDSPINMMDVIDFYYKVYKNTETREEVINNIANYAAIHFSYKASFETLVSYINE